MLHQNWGGQPHSKYLQSVNGMLTQHCESQLLSISVHITQYTIQPGPGGCCPQAATTFNSNLYTGTYNLVMRNNYTTFHAVYRMSTCN
jgi:hypothetical protein